MQSGGWVGHIQERHLLWSIFGISRIRWKLFCVAKIAQEVLFFAIRAAPSLIVLADTQKANRDRILNSLMLTLVIQVIIDALRVECVGVLRTP